jgi:hypothetical protein
LSERDRIKMKIQVADSKRWWGDDFDVRFFLISKIHTIHDSVILDIGGGIGIICSEFDKSNLRVNLDNSFEDLKICKNKMDSDIQNVCASMTNLPFKNNSFHHIICSNILEVAKELDIKIDNIEKNDQKIIYPTMDNILSESKRVLQNFGEMFITTPNNAYYNSKKLTFNELNNLLKRNFLSFELYFFNTFPKFSNTKRKLNMANIIPKILGNIVNSDKIIKKLIKKKSKNNYSVSFFVKIKTKD